MAKAFASLKESIAQEYVLLKKRLIRFYRPQQTIATVFLSGVQRSGTNSIMTVLERSWDTDVFMERDPRAFDGYLMQDDKTIGTLIKSSRARCVVIKALHEAHDLPRLMDTFAPSKGIWVFRHYGDVVNSILARWPGGRNKIDEIVLQRKEGNWRAKGMSASTRSILEEHYKPEMSDASANALFWFYRNQLFFDQKLHNNKNVYLVRYESIVLQPARYVRSLADFLGISCSQSMIKVLHSGSIKKAASPPIDENVKLLCEEMLDRLNACLEHQQAGTEYADESINAASQTA